MATCSGRWQKLHRSDLRVRRLELDGRPEARVGEVPDQDLAVSTGDEEHGGAGSAPGTGSEIGRREWRDEQWLTLTDL